VEKSRPKFWATSALNKLLKVNKIRRKMGENSPNPGTLSVHPQCFPLPGSAECHHKTEDFYLHIVESFEFCGSFVRRGGKKGSLAITELLRRALMSSSLRCRRKSCRKTLPDRVTRLGDFSPIGQLFTLEVFLKAQK
jgi:hypothetical protein